MNKTLVDILTEPGTIAAIAGQSVGVSFSQLHRIKAGTSKPTMKSFCIICRAAGVDPVDVLKNEDCYLDTIN